MKSKTTIEVNGKRYDAETGAVLGVASAPVVHTGRNIDGFFRARTVTTSTAKTPPIADNITTLAAPTPTPKQPRHAGRNVNHARPHTPQAAQTTAIRVHQSASQSQTFTVHRGNATLNHTKHHTQQHAKTLRREAVQRPGPSLHKQLSPKGTLQHAVPSLIASKKSVASIDTQRLARAQSTPQSLHIAHHANHVQAVQATLAPLAVQPVPVRPQEEVPPATPAPQPSRPADMFEHALANATNFVDMQAHKAHFRKKARTHVTSMTAGTLALLVIAGFAAYQNTPGLQLKVASVKAGVSTGMPDFKAAGFAYNGVSAGDGKLTVGFTGTAGDYQITQTNTNLSDSDMIQDIGSTGADGSPSYSTVQAGTTTVYRFGNTDATWVANGKWYTVTGTGALTDDQVKSLVQNV